ncbi:MAG: SAM-dependent methyltransferase [Candidatus Amulumruptor caecigallinarius]|nr:SAM-dependent methyltransferase [Candidatus Amulumruptor caecigallinarius]MCM1396872.1 SAM-dependent methyltransferase [Candidatus Amulumruptor caecigallinarius]MCM1454184.1 SAM-dependent methyltransferase [bacterium]
MGSDVTASDTNRNGSGTLYLLPVPLSDTRPDEVLPAANIAVASRLRHFIVENVRSARRFLKRCNPAIEIDALTFSVLDVNTPESDVTAMMAPLRHGEDMGVISEAGCPAVADPGALAVAEAQRMGAKVVPLVGPSSILMALMGSGFNGQSFAFRGYLPIDEHERASELRRLERISAKEGQTQIFIETPYRNTRLITTMLSTLADDTQLCVATDITGPAQRIVTRSIKSWRGQDVTYCHKVPTIFLIHRY